LSRRRVACWTIVGIPISDLLARKSILRSVPVDQPAGTDRSGTLPGTSKPAFGFAMTGTPPLLKDKNSEKNGRRISYSFHCFTKQ
jgi:hypothetical protein